MRTTAAPAMDRLLDPLARSLPPDAARARLDLSADPDVQARIPDLAEKCNECLLTPEERQEYESYVQGINLITLLQTRARLLLSKSKAS